MQIPEVNARCTYINAAKTHTKKSNKKISFEKYIACIRHLHTMLRKIVLPVHFNLSPFDGLFGQYSVIIRFSVAHFVVVVVVALADATEYSSGHDK